MALAALRFVLDMGTARIQDYCDTLFAPVIAEAADIGFTIEPRAGRGAHLFGMRMPANMDLHALHAALQRQNVFASLRGSALRVSPNVYNSERDAAALISALRAVTSAGTIAAHP
jgi:selenocysteine lyase/cysteine desulfurase